jgi:hypothetical protein
MTSTVDREVAQSGAATFRPWLVGVIRAAVIVAVLAPVFRATYPIGVDLPNHLARAHILSQLPTNPDLQRYYLTGWDILPNLAFDVIVVPLLSILPTYLAAKLFIALAMLMMIGGVAALRKQLYGRVGLMPLMAALFVYNIPMATGLANFYFGVGLVLLAVSSWLATRTWTIAPRLAVFALFATALFFTHLFAFGAYGFVLLTLRVQNYLQNRRLDWQQDLPFIGQFLVPMVFWFFVKSPTHGTLTFYGSLKERGFMLMSPVSYLMDFDVLVAGVLVVLLVWLIASGRLKTPTPMAVPVMGLAVLSLIMPMTLFGVWIVHVRLPLITVLLLLSAAEVHIPEHSLRRLLVGILILIALLRLEKVDGQILRCDAKRQQFVAALNVIPDGSRLLPVIDDKSDVVDCMAGYYWHIPALAVIEKSTFSPMMFAQMAPLGVRDEFRRYLQKQPRPVSPQLLHGKEDPVQEVDWSRAISEGWRRDFDVLIWLHPETQPHDVPGGVEKIGGGSFFTFYRIQGKN